MTTFDDLWSSLPIPAMTVTPDDTISRINSAAESFLNQSTKSMYGKPVWDNLMIDAPLDAALARARADEVPLFINDVDVGTGDRPPVQCNIQIAPMSGAKSGTVLVLLEPREHASRLGGKSNAKTAAKTAIGMAEMLAHEIKNPLAGIAGAAQLLSMNLRKEDLEMTDLIVAETRRIVKLLEQVEEFGNVSPPALRPVNVHDVLDRARKSALLGYAAHMRVLEAYDPSLPPTFADGDQLLQVFLNLIKNAAEASKGQTGTITLKTYYDHSLRLRRRDGTGRGLPLQIEVIDDGPGLPEDIANDIFDPFISGRENGTGLGLALVSKIISDHDGWISVDSVPGHTSFRISMPIAPKEES